MEAANRGAPCVGRAQAFQNLNGSGLSRAIRPEQAEDLTLLDGKADSPQRLHVTVALGQVFDLENGTCHILKFYSIPQIAACSPRFRVALSSTTYVSRTQ